MAKTGWIKQLAAAGLRDRQTYILLEESAERQLRNAGLQSTLKLYKKIAATRDIAVLLTLERLALQQEIQFYANSAEEHNSIKTALQQLGDADNALLIVVDAESYRKAMTTYSSKRIENGLPLDGFREFIKSHTTRLTNRLAGQLSGPEKELLRQRKKNLHVAKEEYVILQKRALEVLT